MTTVFSFNRWPESEILAFVPRLIKIAIKDPGAFVSDDKGRQKFAHFPVDEPELIPDFFIAAGFEMLDALKIAAVMDGKKMPMDAREELYYRRRQDKRKKARTAAVFRHR